MNMKTKNNWVAMQRANNCFLKLLMVLLSIALTIDLVLGWVLFY